MTRTSVYIILLLFSLYFFQKHYQKQPKNRENEQTLWKTLAAKFDDVWDQSFKHGYTTRHQLRRLDDLAADTQTALKDAEDVLPHDMYKRQDIRDIATRVKNEQFVKMQDLRDRCGASLLFPRPIEDLHYRHLWKAANDHDDFTTISRLEEELTDPHGAL